MPVGAAALPGAMLAGMARMAAAAARWSFAIAIAAQAAAIAIHLPNLDSHDAALSELLVVVTMLAAATGTLLSAVAGRDGRARLPWLLLGTGLLSYTAGQAYFFFVQETVTTFPEVADAFWLAAYPGILAALALLVREQHEDRRLGISFDAAIVAVAVGALTHEFVMDRVVVVDHSANPFGEQLFAYSILDLGIAIMLGLLALQSRGRVGGSYVAFSLGAVALLAAEFFHARALVDGGYVPGTILDTGWSAAVLLLALSCRFDATLPRVTALRGRSLYLMSVGSFAVAFVLLLYAALTGWHEDPGVIVFAALLPFLILARLVVSVRENDRLARDNRWVIRAAGEGTFRQDSNGRIVAVDRPVLETLRKALAEDRLVVHAQPIVEVATGDRVRDELLVRMIDEAGETVPPGSFLSAAERFGLIQEVDLQVLEKALEQARLGRAVAANVSGRSLNDRRYIERLEAAILGGVDPSLLDFEITETAAIANMEDAEEFARSIRRLGCTLSLDDFGTGFSSFAYLKHIPAQCLKIDAEFIHELKRNPADQQLVEAIVSIARGLGQKTVAEGVEDAETLAMARELGVDYAQGYFVGRPEAAETVGCHRAAAS